ncbi:MAG TPA: cell division protein FtsA [Terriglobales bacterium]|nr:cell division protein FtsA [Terriglobales bacterium]
MGKQPENVLAAIDVGSAKTCVLVAESGESGLRYLGHGVAESRGSRKGVIVDLEKAIAAIQRAMVAAEEAAGVEVEHGVTGIAGAHIRGVNSRGGVVLGSRAREITRDDVRQAVERARAITLPPDRKVLHLLPQEFLLDEQTGIRDPLGMMATRLEVKVHVATAADSASQNVVTALNRAGIHVDDTIFEALASAESVLRADERELGVCLADIGAGSTDVVVCHNGVVVHTAVIPIGGDHFTSDVAVGLRTPLVDAEKIKRMFGCAVVTRIPEANEIEVPAVGDRPSRLMPQRLLGEVLEPRARELFEMLRDNLRHAGVFELCGAGLVLTGGGARLNSMTEIAEDVLRKPARLAAPAALGRMPETLAEPEYATVLGMATYAQRSRVARGAQEQGIGAKLKSLFARKP